MPGITTRSFNIQVRFVWDIASTYGAIGNVFMDGQAADLSIRMMAAPFGTLFTNINAGEGVLRVVLGVRRLKTAPSASTNSTKLSKQRLVLFCAASYPICVRAVSSIVLCSHPLAARLLGG